MPDARCTQVFHAVLHGERPPVPLVEELPGLDTAQFGGLDAYCQLMRSCWDQMPARRPAFVDVVRTLRDLLDLPAERSW